MPFSLDLVAGSARTPAVEYLIAIPAVLLVVRLMLPSGRAVADPGPARTIGALVVIATTLGALLWIADRA